MSDPPAAEPDRGAEVQRKARVHPTVVALGCVAGAAASRLLLEQRVPGLLPFLFTFPAVIGATLAAGTLAGWTAMIGCQLLTLAFVLPRWIRDSGERPQEVVNLALATVSLAVAVWATASFRRLQLEHRRSCERETATLALLVNEIDHRTRNNFQIAATLLSNQGAAAQDERVREELEAAAGRLVSIAAVYGKLSSRQLDGSAVALREHLEEICAGLRGGLLPPGVALTVAGDGPIVSAATALTIGLVVNEWVTNAVKHAFADAVGKIAVQIADRTDGLMISVRDDGAGLPAGRTAGAGSRLLASFAEALEGRVERRNDGGAVCTLMLPPPAAKA